ncbi:hypothetical protein HA402_013786 [Bradysia odoriphaga]|nr:hypothetical protein HA402_013786 [Bradysia odoriphaga]
MPVLRNEYHTEICEKSTIDETMRCTNPNEIFSVRDHSFTRQSRVNQNVDTPLKSNTILKADKWEVEKELLQTRHDSTLRLSNQEPDERPTTVQDIVDNDVLGVSGESGNGNTIEDLLWPVNVTTPHPLQTSAAKLLNALTSFKVGRDYFNRISMMASNSKLRADLRFMYELFVKHRADNTSTHAELSANNVRQDVNSEIDNQTEQLIRVQNLMQCPEIIAEELSTEPSRSFPSDLRSYIHQLYMDKGTVEMDHTTPDEDRNDQSANRIESNPGAEILYSKLNSGLEQSSSLLSSGSQCASSECKDSAIKSLKMQSVRANSSVEMDHEDRKLLKNSSFTLNLEKVYENTAPKVLTDYSDLSSIAKDRDARNEILENDSFIDELCEKVLKRLTSKLGANFFCGPNCNTNEKNNNCCPNVESNVQ